MLYLCDHILPPRGDGRSLRKHIFLPLQAEEGFPSPSPSLQGSVFKNGLSFSSSSLPILCSCSAGPRLRGKAHVKCFCCLAKPPGRQRAALMLSSAPHLCIPCLRVSERQQEYTRLRCNHFLAYEQTCLGGKPFSQTEICLETAKTLFLCAKNINQFKSPSPRSHWESQACTHKQVPFVTLLFEADVNVSAKYWN